MNSGREESFRAEGDPAALPHRAGYRRRELLWTCLILVCGVALPLAVTWAGGALGLVRNDDWSYSRALFGWWDSGHLYLTGWNEMSLVGALVPALSVAWMHSVVALKVLTAVLGGMALIAVFRFARRLMPVPTAAGCALGIALSPLWIPLASSFMTDIPALCWASMAGWAASRGGRAPTSARLVLWFVAAMFFAVWTFTVRQSGVVIAAAVVASGAVALFTSPAGSVDRRRSARWLAFAFLLGAAAMAAFYWWRMSLPNAGPLGLSWSWASVTRPLRNLDRLGFSLGALLVPATLLVVRPSMLRLGIRRHRLWAAVCAVSILAVLTRHLLGGSMDEALLTDHLTRFGAYSTTITGDRIPVVPSWAFDAVVCISAANLWVLLIVGSVVPWRRLARQRPVESVFLGVVGVGSMGVIVALWALGRPTFDRHLLLPSAFLSVLFVWGGSQLSVGAMARAGHADDHGLGAPVLRVASLTAVLMFSVYLGAVSANFDAVRWEAALTVQRETTIDASRIDGGLEWVGAHSSDSLRLDRPTGATPWSGVLSGETMCVLVVQSATRDPGLGTLVEHSSLLGVDRWFYARTLEPSARCHR